MIRHNTNQGARWIEQHGAAQIVYTEALSDYLSARKRETQIKKWSRVKKEKLIKGVWK